MIKFLKIIFVLFFLAFFPFLIQASCTGFGEPVNPPDLYSPADNADVSIPVTLDWSDVENAKSYYVAIYKDGDLVSVFLPTISEQAIGLCSLFKNTTYEWKVATCLNSNGAKCGTDCCDDESGYNCADFSETRTFNTTEESTISPPKLTSPTSTDGIPTVNLSKSLRWKAACGAKSYRYEIKENGIIKLNKATSSIRISFNNLWDELDPGTTYSWHVKSCWDEEGGQCEEDWSQDWQFKTSGGVPVLVYPDNNAVDVVIPINLKWENIDGTISYSYEISSTSDFSSTVASGTEAISEALINYPEIRQSNDYWWRVKSCVDEQSSYCGSWSSAYVFTTFLLSAPCVFDGVLDYSCPFPVAGGSLYTYQNNISWQAVEGAKAYKYKIDYASKGSGEASGNCVAGQPIAEGITTNQSINVSLRCLGEYNWWLQSCLDEECTETSPLTPMLTFHYIQPSSSIPSQFGFVPCGRMIDNPKTSWNERDDCEAKHIFVLLKNIIDFVLWRAGIIALAFLIISTAVVSYFSLGAPGTIVNVKRIWQNAGKGYLMMFMAWWIVSMVVSFLGFTDTWWSLPF